MARWRPTRSLHVSLRGTAAVARFEGFSARPYRDAVGVWTIGYGHTKGVGPHTPPWTRRKALRILRYDLNHVYAPAVRALHGRVPKMTQNMFDALVSFVYNLGPGVLSPQTGIGHALRQHHWKRAADEMLKWDKAGGRRLLGLTRRRRSERRRFLRGLFVR